MDKEDRRRIKQLLTDAVLVLCKASLRYQRKFTVEGLLGITLDSDEVHLININELVENEEEDARTNGRDHHESKRSSTIHQGASVMKRHGETPSGRSMQELSRIAEKRSSLSSTSENDISEKRRRSEDMPVDLARVKNEVSQRNAEGAVDLSGAGDKTATMNDIAASAVRAVQQGLAQSLNPTAPGIMQPRFPQQMATPRALGSVPSPFNNYAQFSLTPGLSPFRGRPRLSATVNSPMDTICGVCNFRCNTKTELYNHANTMKCKICPCPHCPKAFCDPGKLNQHITVRHEEPKFSCPLCGHRYSTKQNMQIHIRRHHGDQLYMQMMVQQSVRFHGGPNSPIPGLGGNSGLPDFPFTPGPGEDSQEATSQSEDDEGSYHAPLSPVNITPTASYTSMPLFPDQQAPVPISEASADASQDQPDVAHFPNLSHAMTHKRDHPGIEPDDRDADDESEKGLDLHVSTSQRSHPPHPPHPPHPLHLVSGRQPLSQPHNHQPPVNNGNQPLTNNNHDEPQDQPLNMRYNQPDHHKADTNGTDQLDQLDNNKQLDQHAGLDQRHSDHAPDDQTDPSNEHAIDEDRFDNPPELTLSSELSL